MVRLQCSLFGLLAYAETSTVIFELETPQFSGTPLREVVCQVWAKRSRE